MTSRVPYAEVIGDPIGHSKSPLIHKFWLEKLGMEGDYRATRVQSGEVASFVKCRLEDPDWRGCNVTMPLKREALAFAGDDRFDRAEDAGAANLILRSNQAIAAENSDVFAVEHLLAPHFCEHEEVVVHLVGTGGAAAAAAVAVHRVGPPVTLFVYARDEERAVAFQKRMRLAPSLLTCHVIGRDQPWGSTTDVVINATPLGMTGHDPLPLSLRDLRPGATVFDMVYDPLQTALLAEARERGMRVITGLQMLVEQAAVSFNLLFGSPPPRAHDAELQELLTA